MATDQSPGAYQYKLRVVTTRLNDGGTSMSPHIPHCPGSGGLERHIQKTWSHFKYNLQMLQSHVKYLLQRQIHDFHNVGV